MVDDLLGLAGLILAGLSLIDAMATFWHSTVLIYPGRLEHIAASLLLPFWPWILVSIWMIFGNPRRYRCGPWFWQVPWRKAIPYWLALAVISAVLGVGFYLGAAKGSLRILPSGSHQVSTLGLNVAGWTTVSPAGYRLWAARFIREDAFFALFGIAMIGFRSTVACVRRRVPT